MMRIEDVAKAYASVDTPRQLEQRMNNGAIGDFGISMVTKLSKSAENGRGGWYDPTVISVDELRQQLDAQLLKPAVDYGWDKNPWVAAYTFEVIAKNVDEVGEWGYCKTPPMHEGDE